MATLGSLDSMRRRLSSIVKPPIGIEHLTESNRLFDMEFLEIDIKHRGWFEAVNIEVFGAMAEKAASHDYAHIQRVVLKVHELHVIERHRTWVKDADPLILIVAALCHGLGDITYAEEACSEKEMRMILQKESRRQEKQRDVIFNFLRTMNCPPAIAGPASLIASLVVMPRQLQEAEEEIVGLSQAYPSLKLLQDADRLDALGWVGIIRAGTNSDIRSVVRLIDEVFVDYPARMHTKTARREAERRWIQMSEFRDGVLEQMDCCGALRP